MSEVKPVKGPTPITPVDPTNDQVALAAALGAESKEAESTEAASTTEDAKPKSILDRLKTFVKPDKSSDDTAVELANLKGQVETLRELGQKSPKEESKEEAVSGIDLESPNVKALLDKLAGDENEALRDTVGVLLQLTNEQNKETIAALTSKIETLEKQRDTKETAKTTAAQEEAFFANQIGSMVKMPNEAVREIATEYLQSTNRKETILGKLEEQFPSLKATPMGLATMVRGTVGFMEDMQALEGDATNETSSLLGASVNRSVRAGSEDQGEAHDLYKNIEPTKSVAKGLGDLLGPN